MSLFSPSLNPRCLNMPLRGRSYSPKNHMHASSIPIRTLAHSMQCKQQGMVMRIVTARMAILTVIRTAVLMETHTAKIPRQS